MEKVSMKRKSVKDRVEYEIREDDLEGEIIDLVDPADDYLETIETSHNLSEVEFDDLADTLDEEFRGIDARDSKGKPTGEKEMNPDFEQALVQLFESSELAAAKLIEEEFREKEPVKKSIEADDDHRGGSLAHGDSRAQATNEKDGTESIPKPKKEFSKNLFLNIEVVEETPGGEAGAKQAALVDGKPGVTSAKTNWLDSGRYYPESVQTIDREIAEYEKKIEKLVHKKRKIKKTYEQLRSILYLEGEELKKAVAIILAKYWSLKLSFMNKAKRAGFNENILIKHNNRIIITKIKGTHSVYPSNKFITQVWQDLHFSGLGARADGALIVNYDIENSPESRRLAYADEDAEQLDDLIFIDTRVLHKLTTAIIDGDLAVEEARTILFTKGRVEFKGCAGGQPTSPDNS
jgi:hypothetical protein